MLAERRETRQGRFCPARGTTTPSEGTSGRDSGSSYYRARYYDPTTGRFLREDPVGFGGGINKYAYVANSATNFLDPWGLCKDQAEVLRCAASLSQAGSVGNIAHNVFHVNVPKVLGSNAFGDLAGLLVGPEPGTDPALAGLARVDQAAAVGLEGIAGPVLEHAAGQVTIDTFGSVSMPVSYATGVYNPIAAAETAGTTLGESAISGFVLDVLGGVAHAKLIWDAGIFVGAWAVCEFF